MIFPQAPGNKIRVISNFFGRKFADIFASQGAPTVSTTPAANFATGTASVVDMIPVANLRKLIHEKSLKSKISWHCPFKVPSIKQRRRYSNNYYTIGSDWKGE